MQKRFGDGVNGDKTEFGWHDRLSALLAREWPRFVLWLPVALGIGIAWFFALSGPTRPQEWLLASVCAFVGTGLASRAQDDFKFRSVALGLMGAGLVMGMVALGGTAAAWRLPRLATPVLHAPLEQQTLSGVIEDIVVAPGALKLTLGELRIDALPKNQWPHRLRITSRQYSTEMAPGKKRPVDFAIGDHVILRATLYPAPPPSSPGQFDVARNFFFQGIGGVGFTNDRITVLTRAEDKRGWQGWIADLRLRVGEEIRQGIGGAEGAIATALISGQQDAIPQSAVVAMRAAGLSHVLSISGLHLAIAAGIVFVVARLLLLFLLPARWRDSGAKKIAAFLALLSSFAYLLLSGAPVAAERSYVMVALVMLAVLLDRQALSIRSVMLAAFILLLWQPEMLLSISFQLSFAATLAIVAGAEAIAPLIRRWQAFEGVPSGLRRLGLYVFVSVATSTVATLATAPLVMDGFAQFNSYGVLSNLLLGPLVDLWIMPLVVVCLVMLPFGIPHFVLWPLGKGILGMIWLAEWVAGLPGAQLSAPTLTPLGLGLVVFGGLWLMLWRTGGLRLLAVPAMLLGIALAWTQSPPILLIGEDAKQVAARLPDGRWGMLNGSIRNMRAKSWATRLGTEFVRPEECGLVLCHLTANGQPLLVRFDPRSAWRSRPRIPREETPEEQARRAPARARAEKMRAEKDEERRQALSDAQWDADAACDHAPPHSIVVDLRVEKADCGLRSLTRITRRELAVLGNTAVDEMGDGWRVQGVMPRQGQWPWAGAGPAAGFAPEAGTAWLIGNR